jgi:hypothetical protein
MHLALQEISRTAVCLLLMLLRLLQQAARAGYVPAAAAPLYLQQP